MKKLDFKLWLIENEMSPIEWHSDVDRYHSGLVASDLARPGFVTVNEPSYYHEGGRKVFHNAEGTVGFSLQPHDHKKIEIAGVYNTGGELTRGHGVHAIKKAVRHGGNYLECYEGGKSGFSLPVYYFRHLGAQPVKYKEWDDKYAHPKWDYETYGRPGIIEMKIPDIAFEDLESWLSRDHSQNPDELAEFKNRILKVQRGETIMERKHNKHRHPLDHIERVDYSKLTPEDCVRLSDLVDEIYFGGGKPPKVVEQAEDDKK